MARPEAGGRGANAGPPTLDRLGRPLRDLRISVTDRCNFRCRYCMPREVFGSAFEFLPRSEILSFEEIARIARICHRLGVRKYRVSGGEPLLRRDLPELIRQLAELPGADLALTTNGSLLARRAKDLAAAGLQRVTVSLDALDDDTFGAINDCGCDVRTVLDGIEAAVAAGLTPVKINAVIKAGVNEEAVAELAARFRGSGQVVRFIEYMDVGSSNGWRMDQVVSGRRIVERINARFPLEPEAPAYRGEVARRWRYRDGQGEVGIVASVTQPFCGDCTRLRLSADGRLYTCLFAVEGTDIRGPLRAGGSDDGLSELIAGVWAGRSDRYSEKRSEETRGLNRIEMSYIGG